MKITTKQNQYLRRLAHHLKPVIIIGGSGLTQAVLDEIDIVLERHELIKVKMNAGDRTTRQEYAANISTNCHCHHVQSIGRIAIFFRKSKESKISLPK